MANREHHADPDFATTLAHGLSLLQCFRVNRPQLSNKALSDLTGLSKATVSRLTYTLQKKGLITFDPQARLYRLGPTTLAISHPLLASLRLRQIASPLLQGLARSIQGSASVGMRDRLTMVYVETVRGHASQHFVPDIGVTLPLLKSAMGRAWLCGCSEEEREGVIRDLRTGAPAEWRAHRSNLEIAAEELNTDGYCTSGDCFADIVAVAVPMKRTYEGTTLVFNCGVIRSKSSSEKVHSLMGPGLVSLVRRVEADLADLEAAR